MVDFDVDVALFAVVDSSIVVVSSTVVDGATVSPEPSRH